VATATLILTLLMLLSWAVLPAAKTKRHYLNVSLVVSIVMIEVRKAKAEFDSILN
jgi:uncharacterized BrkB/YihY/UPF0761 family membrane protein